MEFFNERIDKTVLDDAASTIVDSEFRPRALHRGDRRSSRTSGEKFEFPVAWGDDLQAEHERYLTEKHFQRAGDPVRLPAHDQAVLHAA